MRIELDEEAREPYSESGRLVLSPRARSIDCDLRVMVRAFAELEQQGIVALANAGYTQSEGWTDVAERAKTDGASAVFWHQQNHDAFDGVGNLTSSLLLHWRGDANAIIAGLRGAGFVVEDAPPESTCIEVLSGPTGEVALETFDQVRSAANERERPRVAAKRIVAVHAGPLELAHAFRGVDRQPVTRFAFDPQRAERIAFAQNMDSRGFPTAPAYIVDLAKGEVERAMLSDTRIMGVGGMRFLRDGRLVMSTTQQRKVPDEEWATSCLALHVWAAEQTREEELFVQPFSHISDTSLLTFDDMERFAAIGQPQGVDVYAVPPRGEPWPEPLRVRIAEEPTRAYTRTAISPDGEHVVWCDDWSVPLTCFARSDGSIRWRHPPENEARSQLRFTPDSSVVAIQVGRRDSVARSVRFFAVENGAVRHEELTEATRESRCFAFHPAGGCLAVGGTGKNVRLYAYPEAKLIADVQILASGYVSALEFSRDGNHLAVGGSKGDVALFRFASDSSAGWTTTPTATPAPSRPITSLAAKGVHPLIGATGRLTGGPFKNYDATVKLVGSGGTKLRVAVKMFDGDMDVDVDGSNFRDSSEVGKISEASPYRVGDVVFVHDGHSARGMEVEVIDVEEQAARVLVLLPRTDEDDEEDGEEDRRATIDFDDITLVRPLRRDPLSAYVAALDRVRFLYGQQQPLQHWCVMQLDAVDWDLEHANLAASGSLAAEFAALEQQIWDDCARRHALRRQQLGERFESLTPEECVERWKAEWANWVDWRNRVISPIPPEWNKIRGSDDASRQRMDAVWALRERLQKKNWSAE